MNVKLTAAQKAANKMMKLAFDNAREIRGSEDTLSVEAHLDRWDAMVRDEILADVHGDRHTHAHESFAFGYLKAAANQFVYGSGLSDGSSAQQDVWYQATLIRNYALAHYQMDDSEASMKRFAGAINWNLKKHCPEDRVIDINILKEEFPEMDDDELNGMVAEHQKEIMESLRPRLEGFLSGARYDDIPNRIASEWDERTALTAIKNATGSLLSFFEREITKCKKGKFNAVMKGLPEARVQYWNTALYLANIEYDDCSAFIEKHDLTWD